jgi:hypothetical protein
VWITEVNLGMPVLANGNEGDTRPTPMAIAPLPGGRIAPGVAEQSQQRWKQ